MVTSSKTEINIVLKAIDEASRAFTEVGGKIDKLTQTIDNSARSSQQLDQATKKTSSSFNALKSATSTAAGVLMRDMVKGLSQSATEAFDLGAKAQSLKSSFESMKRATGAADLSLEGLRKATKNTVSDVDLLTAANKAMSLGLPTQNLDQLMQSAMKLGRVMGIDTLSAVDSLATGIGRQSKQILDNLGVVFSADEAYQWYAETLGVTTEELDDNQKKLAWQEYAMQQVITRAGELGDVNDDMITQQEQMKAAQDNLNTSIGESLSPLSFMKDYVDDIIGLGSTIAMTTIPKWIEQHGGLKESLASVIGRFGGLKTSIGEASTATDTLHGKIAGLNSISLSGITSALAALTAFLPAAPAVGEFISDVSTGGPVSSSTVAAFGGEDYKSKVIQLVHGGTPSGNVFTPASERKYLIDYLVDELSQSGGGLFAAGPDALVSAIKIIKEQGYLGTETTKEFAARLADRMGWAGSAKTSFIDLVPLAKGGIAYKPTLALIGENTPEAVVPLDRAGGLGNVTVHAPIYIYGDPDERILRVMTKNLKNVVVEASSSGALSGHSRIRIGSQVM